jgi:ABC-type microcin C transport system permease subunit YejB
VIGKNRSIPSFFHAILLIILFSGIVKASVFAQDDILNIQKMQVDSSTILKPRIV